MTGQTALKPSEIGVVIPALNEAERIADAIESCFANGITDVVVSDGGSQDGTVRVAEKSGADVVHSARGRGTQTAAGVEALKTPVLLFLHADNQLTLGCADAICLAWSTDSQRSPTTRRVFWGGFRQRIEGDSRLYRALEWGNVARIRYRGLPFGDQGMFVDRIGFESVGGIPLIGLMEDVRLSQRLRRLRWPILLDQVIRVDARRWQERGVVRQTLRNWGIQCADAVGVSEERLKRWYG
ncbi:MAG: TIGR04283 family arsenosugar biosynthesis glycosyltransferase [Planctomycetota bacterium]